MGDYGFGGDLNGNGSFDPGDYGIWEETMKDSSGGGGYRSSGSGSNIRGSGAGIIGGILLWIVYFCIVMALVFFGLCLCIVCPPLGGLMIMGGFELMKKM